MRSPNDCQPRPETGRRPYPVAAPGQHTGVRNTNPDLPLAMETQTMFNWLRERRRKRECARLQRRIAEARHAIVGGPFPVSKEVWNAWISREKALFDDSVDEEGFYFVDEISDHPGFKHYRSLVSDLGELGDSLEDDEFPVAHLDMPYHELQAVLGEPHTVTRCREFFWTAWHILRDDGVWTIGAISESPLDEATTTVPTWSIWGSSD